MASITLQFVRPDRLLFEGTCASLVLVTSTGELGVFPGHAPEICALGNGIVRIQHGEDMGDTIDRVIVMGGYAEITPYQVTIIARHARREDDIDPHVVGVTRKEAEDSRNALPEDDGRRAYYDEKIAWCDMLLEHAPEGDQPSKEQSSS